MSRKRLLVLLWIPWPVCMIGFPSSWLYAFGAAMAKMPVSRHTLLGLNVLFACDAVFALILTGVLLEREGKLTDIRLDWVVPLCWSVGLIGLGSIAYSLHTGGADPIATVSENAMWAAGLGLAAAITLSAGWFTRRKDAKRTPALSPV